MSLFNFFLGIPGLGDKEPDPVGTIKKMHTIFFRDVETERGKDATVEVAKKYEIILAEMREKFEKIIEMMENKKEELSKESDNYLNELEELEKKAEKLEELLKTKIARNYTYNNSNNSIFQPQSIMGPSPDINIDIFEIFLDTAYKIKIKKGEIAYQKKYEEMESMYKNKISILNQEFDKKEQSSDSDIKELTSTIKEILNEMAIVKEKIVKLEEGIWHE